MRFAKDENRDRCEPLGFGLEGLWVCQGDVTESGDPVGRPSLITAEKLAAGKAVGPSLKAPTVPGWVCFIHTETAAAA